MKGLPQGVFNQYLFFSNPPYPTPVPDAFFLRGGSSGRSWEEELLRVDDATLHLIPSGSVPSVLRLSALLPPLRLCHVYLALHPLSFLGDTHSLTLTHT